MTAINKLSVSEALQKIAAGQSVKEYVIDFDRIKVEALDIMNLAKHGVIVPEDSIYYDDEAIEEDEDFAGEWTRIEHDPIQAAEAATPKISVQEAIDILKSGKNLDKHILSDLDHYPYQGSGCALAGRTWLCGARWKHGV
jgi:hypothetical protein